MDAVQPAGPPRGWVRPVRTVPIPFGVEVGEGGLLPWQPPSGPKVKGI